MNTLRSNREIDALFREGRRFANRALVILIRKTPEGRGPQGRVVFVAGKRIGGAVRRTRAKRVLRACVSRSNGPWDGFDVALIAREDTGALPPSDLDAAVRTAIQRVMGS